MNQKHCGAGDPHSEHQDKNAVFAPVLTGPKPGRQQRFSTNGIPPTNRLELWQHHNAKALIPLDIRTIDESPLRAKEVNLRYGSLRFAAVTGSAQVVERNERFIRQNPTDVVAIFFALQGEAFFYHRNGHASLKPGQAVIYDADLPFMRGFSKGLKELVLTIPREDYLALSGGKPLLEPKVVDFHHGATSNLQMRALARLVSDTLLERDSTAEHLDVGCPEVSALEMLRVLVSGERDGASHLDAARNYIEDNLRDPELGAAKVAAAIGISERQLSRIFAETGQPPGSYLRERRLELGTEMLTDPANGRMSVGRIAGELGFASQSYFTRTFKARFGITPLALRRESTRGSAI